MSKRTRLLTWGSLTAALVFLALIAPLNHDESQYLAAAELTRTGRPFVDFLYLQTPLQPYLTAPIAALAAGYGLIALRVATALMALATLWFVFGAQRRLGVGERTAIGATLLLALTYSFQFGATVVRNDMLPAMLLALGIYAAVTAIAGAPRKWLWAAAGLALGAAASSKISYAVPAAAMGIFHMILVFQRRDRASLTDASACAAGALIGLLPIALSFMTAPEAFHYGVFEFGKQGPFHWYRLNGVGHRLGLDWKLIDTATALARGPAGVALILVGWAALARTRRSDSKLLLDLLVIGGLVAALLPTPTWRQYLIPLLPPLFVRLGLTWQDSAVSGRWRTIAIGAFVVTGLVGLVQPVQWASRLAKGKANPITVTREAHWIGERLRAANQQGAVATLSPQVVIDSGFPLDGRFAAGPFLYRSGDLLSDEQQRAFRVVSPRTLDRFLTERPPLAIVTGYEGQDKMNRIELDAGLRSWATRSGYRLERSPFGEAELFVRGSSKAAP